MLSTASTYRELANARIQGSSISNWNRARPDVFPSDSEVLGTIVNNAASRLASSERQSSNPAKNADTPSQVRSPSDNDVETKKVVEIPNLFRARKISGQWVNTLQEWEGLVVSLSSEYFTARLRDLTLLNQSDEFAEIPYAEIDPSDRERLVEGAIFHMIIGYARRSGSQRRETFFYFRRYLPGGTRRVQKVISLLRELQDDAD